jgi:hypothetical protein
MEWKHALKLTETAKENSLKKDTQRDFENLLQCLTRNRTALIPDENF